MRDRVLEKWRKGTTNGRPAMVFGSWRIERPANVKALLIWNKDGCYSALSRAPFFTVHEEVYVLGDDWPLDDSRLPMRSVVTTKEHRSHTRLPSATPHRSPST